MPCPPAAAVPLWQEHRLTGLPHLVETRLPAPVAKPSEVVDRPLSVRQQLCGSTVLLTGASGFLGGVVLEQLLRIAGVRKVYVLMRPKRGADPTNRLMRLLAGPLFASVTQQLGAPALQERVQVVAGDVKQEGLGLEQQCLDKLVSEVEIVLHCAANIDLEPSVHAALASNYVGTHNVLVVAADCPRLRALVHVSSAYANSNQPSGTRVQERVYELREEGSGRGVDVCEAVEALLAMPEAEAEARCKELVLGRWEFSNAYTFSKFAAEHLAAASARQRSLPLTIVRPTYVAPIAHGPLPGYFSNWAACIGYTAFIVMGLYENTDGMAFAPEYVMDLIPVDCVAATVLAAAASTAAATDAAVERGSMHTRADINQPLVVHCASSDLHPMSWREMYGHIADYVAAHPRPLAVTHEMAPAFGRGAYAPEPAKLQAHREAMAPRVKELMRTLKQAGQARSALLLTALFRASSRFDNPRNARNYVFDSRNAVGLEARLAADERATAPLLWVEGAGGSAAAQPGSSWRGFMHRLLAGIYAGMYGGGNTGGKETDATKADGS